MSAQNPASPEIAHRPVDWVTWFLWIMAGTTEPVLYTGSSTAFYKIVRPEDPHAGLIWALTDVALLMPLVLPVLQWVALRRIAPRLNLGIWLAGFLASGFIWSLLALSFAQSSMTASDFLFQQPARFSSAARKLGGFESMSVPELLSLPWAPLLLSAMVTCAVGSAVPAWILASTTHRRWYQVMFAALAGGSAAVLIAQLYDIYGPYKHIGVYHLNGFPWNKRIAELSLRAGEGAVWAAVSGLVFAAFSRASPMQSGAPAPPRRLDHRAQLVALAFAVIPVAMVPPFLGYLVSPAGLSAGAPALRRVFSFAPSRDRSEGEAVLTYTRDAAISVSRFPDVVFAPDGQSFVALTADRSFARVETASGQSSGPSFGGTLGPYERHAVTWSPDGRLILLRSDGPEVKVGFSMTSHQTRIRAFALPDQHLVGEFVNGEGECFNSYARPSMLVEPDGNSLWLACAQRYSVPKPEDLMAVKLAMPSMAVLAVRRFGDSAASGAIQGLTRVGASVWGWQFYDGRFRLHDLTQGRELLALNDLKSSTLGGKLTPQQWTKVDDQHVSLSFCGSASDVATADVPAGVSGLCRTLNFDVRTGALSSRVDRADRAPPRPWPDWVTLNDAAGLRVESMEPATSKAGEIIVKDLATGRQRQRIVSLAQRPIAWSNDGRWLIMRARDQRTLRIYSIAP